MKLFVLHAALACSLSVLTFHATAAQPAPPPPPLPNAAPAVGPIVSDPELEPEIVISRHSGETVEEARVNGRLVWVRVTPAHGEPYFLIPDAGGYAFIRRDSLESGLKVPLWILFSF